LQAGSRKSHVFAQPGYIIVETQLGTTGGHGHFRRVQRISDLPHKSVALAFVTTNLADFPALIEAQSLKNNAVLPFMARERLPCNSNQFSQPWAPVVPGFQVNETARLV
jgi:hypothetical protein